MEGNEKDSNEVGSITLLIADNIREHVTKEELEEAMKFFIHKNVFKTENEKLKEINSAPVGELI